MKKIYFTITGTSYRFGQEFMEPGMTVKLVKEPDNEFDKDRTVQGESYSAGRLYDKIGDTVEGKIMYVLPKGVLAYVEVEL